MKIIKEGDKARLISLCRFDCSCCGCVFECDSTEYRQGYNPKDGNYLTIKCPTCNSDVTAEVRR